MLRAVIIYFIIWPRSLFFCRHHRPALNFLKNLLEKTNNGEPLTTNNSVQSHYSSITLHPDETHPQLSSPVKEVCRECSARECSSWYGARFYYSWYYYKLHQGHKRSAYWYCQLLSADYQLEDYRKFLTLQSRDKCSNRYKLRICCMKW